MKSDYIDFQDRSTPVGYLITFRLREAEVWIGELSPWESRGSKKYLWDEKQLADAIAYVETGQGEPLD